MEMLFGIVYVDGYNAGEFQNPKLYSLEDAKQLVKEHNASAYTYSKVKIQKVTLGEYAVERCANRSVAVSAPVKLRDRARYSWEREYPKEYALAALDNPRHISACWTFHDRPEFYPFNRELWWNGSNIALATYLYPLGLDRVAYLSDSGPVESTIGRYLTRYFSNVLSVTEIAMWAERWKFANGPVTVELYTNIEDIVRAYENVTGISCMKGDNWDTNPARVYENADIALIVAKRNGTESARAICRISTKEYTVPYGPDIQDVRAWAIENGFVYARSCLVGLHIKKVFDSAGNIVMPYLDGESGDPLDVSDMGNTWLVCEPETGEFNANSTSGELGEVSGGTTCECCGDRTRETYTVQGRRFLEEWCEYCLDNDSMMCELDNERYSTSDHTFVTFDGMTCLLENVTDGDGVECSDCFDWTSDPLTDKDGNVFCRDCV